MLFPSLAAAAAAAATLPLAASATVARFDHSASDLAPRRNLLDEVHLSVPLSEPDCSYWMEDLKPQGIAAFNANPAEYRVFRNVKDYGAKGDGRTDDTAAINRAISSGGRCSPADCGSSSTTVAQIYFPAGTYVVSDSIVDYYSSFIVGNPRCMPVIKAASNFSSESSWVYDGNQYQADGKTGWQPTNVFWRQVRNLAFDLTAANASAPLTALHWTVSQATSLQNIVVHMSDAPGTMQDGLFIAEGSGGFVSDLVFHGGRYGLNVGNQQWTMRNITINNAVNAIQQLWDWGWTYVGVNIHNCQVGLNITAPAEDGTLGVGGMVFIDSQIHDTPVGVLMARSSEKNKTDPPAANSLLLENVRLTNVPVAVQGPNGQVALAGTSRGGGEKHVAAWGQGKRYTPQHEGEEFQGEMAATQRAPSLLGPGGGGYRQMSKPQYADVPASGFISIRTRGARGDGKADDTAAINAALAEAQRAGKVLYFNAGTYRVTGTVHVPPGSRIAGEALPVIMSSGPFFADMANPRPVVQVGRAGGEPGRVQWQDMIVGTQGAQAGAVLIEWNLAASGCADGSGLPSGMWEVHTRIGGTAGSRLTKAECRATPDRRVETAADVNRGCIGAFMSMRVTRPADGLYVEAGWLWVADHDVEDDAATQITIYAGRGLLLESAAGAVWLYGTGVEHHVMYNYYLAGTRDVFLAQAQSEVAYYQANPGATVPFPRVESLGDPDLRPGQKGWAMNIADSADVAVYGAGLYSFFDNNDTACSQQNSTADCQPLIFSVDRSTRVSVLQLNTIGTVDMVVEDGRPRAPSADNRDGFVDTVALYRNY